MKKSRHTTTPPPTRDPQKSPSAVPPETAPPPAPTVESAPDLSTLAASDPDASPWPDPVDGSRLLDDLSHLLRRFIFLPKHAEESLALWILHTYAFELRDV